MREDLQGWSPSFARNQHLTIILFKIPVALAMWNQVGSECRFFFDVSKVILTFMYISCPSHTHVCIFQQEYIRSMVLGFQLYPESLHTSSMWIQPRCSVCFHFLSSIPHTDRMPSFSATIRQTRTPQSLVIHIYLFCLLFVG